MWIQYPILVLLCLTITLWLTTFKLRLKAVLSRQITPHDLFFANTQSLSERAILLGKNYDNQFQLPLLFLLGLFFVELELLDGAFWKVSAWIFVVTRLWHSYEHVIAMNLRRRTIAFTLNACSVFTLWIGLMIHMVQVTQS
ncbi:MAPEG family protein [Pseudoalteromonas xiamenensis]